MGRTRDKLIGYTLCTDDGRLDLESALWSLWWWGDMQGFVSERLNVTKLISPPTPRENNYSAYFTAQLC